MEIISAKALKVHRADAVKIQGKSIGIAFDGTRET